MRLTRRGRLTVTLTVVTGLLATTAYVVTRTAVGTALGLPTGPECTVHLGRVTHEWTRNQAMTATTVAGVGARIGASDNGVAAAVAQALRRDGDAPVLDADAAREVYRGLPDAARPSPSDLAVARALLGHDGGALSCTVGLHRATRGLPRQSPGPIGLTARADAVRRELRAVFGKQTLGGFDPRGVTSGHTDGSAHYEGRAIDVFFRPISAANQRRGWAEAQWAVAHAEGLAVATVIFDRRIWSAGRSAAGWRDYRHPDGPTDNPILLHEDHVHVDVIRGR